MMPLLDVQDLRVAFTDVDGHQVELLRGVTLQLHRGETAALVGESGCGKSLTVKAILGLLPGASLRISSGAVLFEGTNLLTLSEKDYQSLRGRQFALVPQHPISSLNPVFTISDQFTDLICFQGRSRVGLIDYWTPRVGSRRKAAIRQKTLSALRQVSLPNPEGVLGRYPVELSGGMCQRVLIAMALVGNPTLLIADEPGTALDVTIQAQINRLLAERVRERSMAMLYVTHDLGIARMISDCVYVMYAGRIVEQGRTSDIFARPRHPYTRGLLKSVPKLSGEPFEGIEGSPPDPRTLSDGCAFRWRCPHAIPRCAEATPALLHLGDGQAAACIRAEELVG